MTFNKENKLVEIVITKEYENDSYKEDFKKVSKNIEQILGSATGYFNDKENSTSGRQWIGKEIIFVLQIVSPITFENKLEILIQKK